MKKINYTLLIAAGLLFFNSSCSLVVDPPSEISAEGYWKTENDAFLGLNACYAQMPAMDIWDEMTTDNAHSHKPWEGPYELIQQNGISTQDNQGYGFTDIRIFNNFIEKVETVNVSEELKARMRAEVRFLRAFSYLNLTSKFGKVPLITSTLEYNGPLLQRDPVEKVRNFILTELEEVAMILPATYNNSFLNEKGRITQGAAHALRARAALYFGDYVEAEKSADAVIKSGQYQLFTVSSLNAAQQKEAAELDQFIDFEEKGIDRDAFAKGLFSYESLWHNENANPSNPEYILTREFMAQDDNIDWGRYVYIRPSQLVQGYSSYEPMQDLIDAYWDIDGHTIRQVDQEKRQSSFAKITAEVEGLDQNGYIAKVAGMDLTKDAYMKEFRNRDSRLYASILFPFKGWHETDFGTFYYRWDPKWSGKDGNESWTGYSYRKMVSLTPYQDQASVEDYPTIRFAEVLLTYAEARVKNTGWDGQAQEAFNKLRTRAGMPKAPTALGQAQALDLIRNERRIELAGEGHRYEDIRRYGNDYASKAMSGDTKAPNGDIVVKKAWNERLMLMPIP
ncbi:RagB/SusD family nutrient uptake outer membrane protein [Sphingobacterium sp. ML3W]|uniref:RagB/SusD family nutrient uptake outer membrane protein n=1 Tax=Sphingobacterium sp. ML3W TaxID=1538644 RepID=UPI0006907CC3|nr:RagB/SusD family nutrient uptake outer membrane protein [Sphingobacterium sp. ML3W]